MSDVVEVKGLKELLQQLDALPVDIERRAIRAAMRASVMQVFAPLVKVPIGKPHKDWQGIPRPGGDLAKSLRIVSTKSKKTGGPVVRLSVGSKQAWYAHILERGARPHRIKPKKSSYLFFGGRHHKAVDHPGFHGRYFMRDAFVGHEAEAVEKFRETLDTKLPGILKRLARKRSASA
jgi:HK97 gp10 family phage protein